MDTNALHEVLAESQAGKLLFPDVVSRLLQGTDGNFYGTTTSGGLYGDGTVFETTGAGALTTLYSFTGGADGFDPNAVLVQSTNGNFYGTTTEGGSNGLGTVFEITPKGVLTTLHSFDGTDGSLPYSALVQATNGNFYGTTTDGGAYGLGTVYEITPKGALTTLHNFDLTDGGDPYAGLVLASNGDFYGTTVDGGANGDGTIYEITSSMALTTLHSFDGTDGQSPYAGLVQATNGSFYGATTYGGANGDGTVFSVAVGLGPFVKTVPTAGKVGTAVTILGTNLTGATSVTFNGTAATFTVVSQSEITTTVPAGATSGKVQVTTPKSTLKSNVAFRILP